MSEQKNQPTNKNEQTPEARKNNNQPTDNANKTKAEQEEASDRVGGDASRTQAKRPEDHATQKPTGTTKPTDTAGRH